jgi:trk system potassium uptake protein TrkH
MNRVLSKKRPSPFQLILSGFLTVILLGAFALMLPISTQSGQWTSFENALFTSTSAICVTGLVVRDTATYWSFFGQFVILVLIQLGGLGIVTVAALISTVSGRKVSLLQRTALQDSISAHHLGGLLRMTKFLFRVTFAFELAGALVLIPTFCANFGPSGVWMALFHSISAFCNAGFDLMGSHSGPFSSLTYFHGHPGVVLPICALIVAGGIGFLTWSDAAQHGFRFRNYRMQSKAILLTSTVLIVLPTVLLFFGEYSALPLRERFCLSLFQAVTPRTAGFNTADLGAMNGAGRAMIVVLMLIGGSPGSTAGGMKTTTVAVLFANTFAVFGRRKDALLFGRRIEDEAVKNAATLLLVYLTLTLSCAWGISALENLPFEPCLFETASAIGTVGLSLGLTPSLGLASHLILIVLMFFGRVGALTVLYALISHSGPEQSRCPAETIVVG